MLVLRRKVGEAFLLGERITVTVLGMEPNGTVNLGIDAPKDVLILRKELQQAMAINEEAAASDATLMTAFEDALFSIEQRKEG